MIEAVHIKKSFGSLEVLKGINLTIEQGKIISIIGASGAGKTTLLQILGTLSKFDSGEVIIDNTNISQLNDNQLSRFRNQHIGFVFQFHHLLPEFTALENVCIPAYIAKKSKKEAEKKALELIEYLGMSERKDHKPHELSGGEKQRIAIARALMNSPKVVFADEPTGNLDSANTKEINELFANLRENFNQTFVIVTHNHELATSANYSYTIKDGLIIQ